MSELRKSKRNEAFCRLAYAGETHWREIANSAEAADKAGDARSTCRLNRALGASLASNWLTAVLRWTLCRKAKDGTSTLQHCNVVISARLPHVQPHDVDETLAATGSLTDEVQRVITGLPNNKALGMDQILDELWQAGHEVTTNELALLLDWILRTGDVPAAWRGGRFARLYEGKGPTESTDSYRGLPIGDHTAKESTGVLAPKVKKATEQFLPPQQCGNTRGGGTNTDHHVVSTFVRYARKHNTHFLPRVPAKGGQIPQSARSWQGTSLRCRSFEKM